MKATQLRAVVSFVALLVLVPPAFANTSKALAKALGSKVKAVVASDRKAVGVLTSDGHYVATTIDGRELGLFYKRSEWRFAESPYFAIDLSDEKNNLVIVPDKKALKTEKTLKDWLWTDYGRSGKTKRSPAVPAAATCRACWSCVKRAGRMSLTADSSKTKV